MSTLGNRAQIWAELQRQPQVDILVVGGGITGAGILREATRQGLKALLVEQKDFAWGTSSRSSKMVHGGLRYIAQGDIKLSRHSARERERLIREAPGLVDRMYYLFPIRTGQFPGKMAFHMLLALYDLLAGIKTRGWHDAASVVRIAPGIRADNLTGANFYADAVTDDSRLVLRVLQQACAEGARVLNYVRATALLQDNGRVTGATLENENGEILEVHARVVINATGAWADRLRQGLHQESFIRPLRGSHIIVPADKLPVREAITLFHPQDRRTTFIFPWEGFTVIGTTDLDHTVPLDEEAAITRQEVEYLLALVRNQFPDSSLQERDIVSTFAGVRPVISRNRNVDPSKEKRDHQVWVDNGLVTVSGGKLTTFRLIARDTLRAAKPFLPHGAFHNPSQQVFVPPKVTAEQLKAVDAARARRLLGRYGDEALNILQHASEPERRPIANTAFSLAELRWSCRNEQVVHLDDLLLRRSRIGLLLPRGGEAIAADIQRICQQELYWSVDHWQQEWQRYRQLWQQYYSVPAA